MKKIIIILTMLLSTSLLHAFPKVYPSVIEMNLEKGRSRAEFTIFNSGEKVKKYKLKINKKDNLGIPSEFSKYLKIFPKYIEIEPGKNQKIRIFAKGISKNKFNIGEVRAAISIEEIKSQAQKKYQSKENNNNVSTFVEFDYVLNMAVYGYIGELISKINIDSLSFKDNQLTAEINNIGNYSYPMDYEILNKKDKIMEKGTLGKILFGEKMNINIKTAEKSFMLKIKETNSKNVLYKDEITL